MILRVFGMEGWVILIESLMLLRVEVDLNIAVFKGYLKNVFVSVLKVNVVIYKSIIIEVF